MPTRPSPLSPRSANANPTPLYPHIMSDASSHSRESSPGAQSKPSQRIARPNPLLKSSEERARLRRKAFLDRIAQARGDQRWDGKSDQVRLDNVDGLQPPADFFQQILRSDYLANQRRWEDDRHQTAPLFADEDDQENELPVAGYEEMIMEQDHREDVIQGHTMSDEVEAVVNQEERELEELLALAEDENQNQEMREPGSERWGSDEEDYDSLFMEYLSSQQVAEQQTTDAVGEAEDSMDTSIG